MTVVANFGGTRHRLQIHVIQSDGWGGWCRVTVWVICSIHPSVGLPRHTDMYTDSLWQPDRATGVTTELVSLHHRLPMLA